MGELEIGADTSLGVSSLLAEEKFALIRQLNCVVFTILLVEQNVEQSLEIATCAHVFENGLVRFSRRSRDLLAGDAPRRSYLGL